MKKVLITVAILIACIQVNYAIGVLSSVYLNPVGGDDARDGSVLYPVRTWDKALSLAADNATIYVSLGAVSVTSNTTFDGAQYGATHITVTPYTGYTGALFAIADNVTGTFTNLTLKGTGAPQSLLSVNNRGTLTIGANLSITDGGEIAMDGGAHPVNLTATPPAGMNYLLLTTYTAASDEGRAIVNAGSVASPMQYFTLVEPASNANVDYEIVLDGATIRLYELPKGGVYLDPLNGNDAYSGTKSSRPVKTLARAIEKWDSRNATTPGIVTDIYVLTRITLTANLTLGNGLKFTRFAADADRPTSMTDYLFAYTGYELTINQATIQNGSNTGTAFFSASNGTLTLNDGATVISANNSHIIDSKLGGTTVMNDGATITKTGTGTTGYCIYSENTTNTNNANVIINGGTITTTGPVIYKNYGNLEINGGVISHTGPNYCINNNYGTVVINDCDITTTGQNAIYNYSCRITINDGIIRNVRTSSGRTIYNYISSQLEIYNATIEGGLTTAIHNESSYTNSLILHSGEFTSTNTEYGTVYTKSALQVNGENVRIEGTVYMASPTMDNHFMTILSPTVTQNYTLRIADGAVYAALVRSNPSIDLGMYESRFTLEAKPGYALAAYANKGEPNRNLVVYDTNGIYVNDYTGDDANAGTSPDMAVKTLQTAAGKTTASKTYIYVCDSTLTISAPQTVLQAAPKDTIRTFLFRSSGTFLLRVTDGGELTLQNVALYAPANNITRFISVDNGGSVQLNTGTTIFMYNNYSTNSARYGIYLNGGSVVMNSGSKITSRQTSSSYYGYGVYATGLASTLTIADDVIIERQYFPAVYVSSGANATIGAAIIRNNGSSSNVAISVYSTNANYVSTVDLNGTIIENNNYRALSVSGVGAVVNMTDGLISGNGKYNTSSTLYQGAVYVTSQGTFNFSGGMIEDYYIPPTSEYIYGEMIYLSGGKMNFTGGTVTASAPEKNAIYVYGSGTNAATTGRLTLSNQASIVNGYIYCNSPTFAPILSGELLDPAMKFNINIGDNMAGTMLVDGTSDNTFPAWAGNFVLNPALTTLSLQQSGDNVIIASSSIYLNGGSGGNDLNDGSSAIKAVKTFTRARERLIETSGNEIIITGTASISNANESTDWDLSFNPNAVVRRGLGFVAPLVSVQSGRSLTLSNITFDGNKGNVTGTNVKAIIEGVSATITINSGTVIRNNENYGIQYSGSLLMNGGEISEHKNYAVNGSGNTSQFIMTGGSIKNNTSYGVYSNGLKYIRLLGGEITQNSYGVYFEYQTNGILEIGGTARIVENRSSGMTSSNAYYLDSLIMTGGEISNNKSSGANLYVNHVSISGGSISNNGYYGLQFYANNALTTTSLTIKYVTIQNNRLFSGLQLYYYKDFVMTGGTISDNTGYGIYATGRDNLPASNFTLTGVTIDNHTNYGLYLLSFGNMTVENVEISNNMSGVYVSNENITIPGNLTMKDVTVQSNNGYGVALHNYLTTSIGGNTLIEDNNNTGIQSNSLLTTSISDNVLVKGNRSATSSNGYAGGIYVQRGTVNITDNVMLEANISTNFAGGIYVGSSGNAVISGNVRIKDCINLTTSTSNGGTAIYAAGKLSMTGGSITGSTTTLGRGTVHVTGTNSDVRLTNVTIRDNTANYGGAIYVNSGGNITLDSDTIINNTTLIQPVPTASPASGAIHLTGGANGRLSLRDKNLFEGQDIYIATRNDRIYIDEALLFTEVGAIRLLANNSGNATSMVTTPGTVVVSPNGTTVTDASQFLTRFTLMNKSGRGLDKGGTDDNHIIIVNEFFIDSSYPIAGNGASPFTPFNSLSQSDFLAAIGKAYTTVWVSGPVRTFGTHTLPVITQNNVNIRRYTGFAVASQPYPAYDSVMITIEPGTSLTIPGGNSTANTFTISGEGGSALSDASIFKNYGTLTLGGYTNLYFNPTAGDGAAVNQQGTFNLSGHVDFNLHSPSTVFLAEDRVINIAGPLTTTTPIGITVETSPTNTHLSARLLVTGSAANVPDGMESLFYNEITPDPLPIGRFTDGANAELMFYIADRNVAGIPIYTSLQDAFDAAVPSNNDEVRLYGNTTETVIIDKRLRYNSNGYAVKGAFTLDSIAQVQLLDDLLADTLYLRATVFSNKTQLDLNSRSAIIANAAYLDLQLPTDAAIGDWYPVNLPFDAKVSDIRDATDTLRQVLHQQDFGIAAFDGQRRAVYGIGNQPSNPDNDWQFYTNPMMSSGAGYMVTAGNGLEALRFKAANLNLFATSTAPAVYFIGPAANIHHGINYLAQPLPMNAIISGGIPAGAIIQVSESLSSDRIGAASYVAKSVTPALVIAPYTNYFYQTSNNEVVTYSPTTLAATVRSQTSSDNAEWRMENAEWGQTSSDNGIGDSRLRGNDMGDAVENNSPFSILHSALKKVDSPLFYELRLSDDAGTAYDALFVAASEYASKERYEIGRDVVKMGTVGHAAQIWSVDFDVALCANEVLMENGTATIPLFIHTPVVGKKYRLTLQNTVSGSEQLWLYRAGKPIQDLIRHPEFTIEGTGYTTDEYSLQIRSNITSNDPVDKSEAHVYAVNNAIVINGLQQGDKYMVYDLSGRLFATGTGVDSQTRIYISRGTYIVQINGISHKVIVN